MSPLLYKHLHCTWVSHRKQAGRTLCPYYLLYLFQDAPRRGVPAELGRPLQGIPGEALPPGIVSQHLRQSAGKRLNKITYEGNIIQYKHSMIEQFKRAVKADAAYLAALQKLYKKHAHDVSESKKSPSKIRKD